MDAAIAIADAEGIGAVTMRRIAQEIGAGAMSLYTYVPDKDRLLDLMVDRVGGAVTPVPITGDWRTDLIALAGSQRTLMLAHPWLPSALPNRRLTGRNMLGYLEQVALIGEAVATGDFPQLAAALAEGGQGREPSFDRIAGWMIVGLVTQANASS